MVGGRRLLLKPRREFKPFLKPPRVSGQSEAPHDLEHQPTSSEKLEDKNGRQARLVLPQFVKTLATWSRTEELSSFALQLPKQCRRLGYTFFDVRLTYLARSNSTACVLAVLRGTHSRLRTFEPFFARTTVMSLKRLTAKVSHWLR